MNRAERRRQGVPEDDWLEWRRQGIGASDVAGVLGLSPWASPYSVWSDKTYGTGDDRDTLAMSFGRRAEPMIAPWFTEQTGLYVSGHQTRCEHPHKPWQRCTIDGRVHETGPSGGDYYGTELKWGDAIGVYEAKTTNDTPKQWETEGIPVHYQCQAQWTMHVTATDHCWFAVLHLAFGRPDLKVYQLDRDQQDIDLITSTVERFWLDHVLTGTPPDTDTHPATTYATKHLPASVGDMVELDGEIAGHVIALAQHKRTLKELEQLVDLSENAIRAALGDATEGFHDGHLIVSHRPQTRTGVDAAALKARLPRVAAKFATESTYRVLRTHNPKPETHNPKGQ
jgi:putative phage-type endonuclease